MKNKKIFILSTLMISLLLTSCGNKEVENQEDNTENNQVLEEINGEVENMVKDIDTQTTTENTGSTDSKVQKLNKTYTSPGGEDEVEFSITMNGDIIENVDTKMVKGSEISEARTKAFQDTVNTELKGKTIEEASKIKIIGGSSLTTEAFKSVLKDVK